MMALASIVFSLFSFLSTFFLIRHFIKNSQKYALEDVPNERSSHKTKTPRVGGVGILLPSLFWGGLTGFFFGFQNAYWILLSGIFTATLVGFYDDLKRLEAKTKFVLLLAITITTLLFSFGKAELAPLSYCLLVLFFSLFSLWATNIFNFMDGIDALAGLQSLPILISFYIVTQNPLCLVFSLSMAAFVLFNFPPAKTFMGDSGSLPIGFMLSLFPSFFLWGHAEQLFFSYNQMLIALSFTVLCNATFIFDGSLTISVRLLQGKNVFKAHREHIYQKAFDKGVKAASISLYNFFLTCISCTFAIYLFLHHVSMPYYLLGMAIISACYCFVLLFPVFTAKALRSKNPKAV
jgi:UDP-GlcNAc:undecaprenyl-phosphate/decaprenyl-phosphate GlcNAc-1-phosphate transferase